MFDIIALLPRGSEVVITGREPGNEWLRVSAPSNQTGWMASELFDQELDLSLVSEIVEFTGHVVSGRVIDPQGEGISAVNVAIFQAYRQPEERLETSTGEDGNFYFYLPKNKDGVWTVEVTGASCQSRIMNDRCRYEGSFNNFGRTWIGLPEPNPIVFEYIPE